MCNHIIVKISCLDRHLSTRSVFCGFMFLCNISEQHTMRLNNVNKPIWIYYSFILTCSYNNVHDKDSCSCFTTFSVSNLNFNFFRKRGKRIFNHHKNSINIFEVMSCVVDSEHSFMYQTSIYLNNNTR